MLHPESFASDEPPSPLMPDEEHPSPQRRDRAGLGWRLWKTWLWLTGPRPERFGPDLAERERLRRSRLVSALLTLALAAIPILIPSALVQPLIWRPVVILPIIGLLVALLNRNGKVTASGLAYIALIDSLIVGYLITKPTLTYGNIPNFDLLILSILIAGMVLPRQLIPLTGMLHIVLIIAIFQFKQHDLTLDTDIGIYFHGQQYTTIVNAILLQVCGAAIAWLHAWSVDRAILRASRAEELAAARLRLNEQARQLSEQKHRLEQGIQALQEAQARVANGDYSVRASLHGNELLPLAVSFNIMAERLSRVAQLEQDHRRLETALQQLLEACNTLAQGAGTATLRATGTLVDRIFPFLARMGQQMQHLIQGSKFADDLRALLQRQQEQLIQVEAQLSHSLNLAKDLKEQAIFATLASRGKGTQEPASSSGQPGSQAEQPRDMEHQAAIPTTLSIALTQQITLLEQAHKGCAQAHELGRHCIHGARILSQRLREPA